MGCRPNLPLFFAAIIMAFSIIALGSCSQTRQVSDVSVRTTESERLQFEFILGGSDQEHYWKQMKAGAVAASYDYGVKVAFSAVGNSSLQGDAIQRIAIDSSGSHNNHSGVIVALKDPSMVLLQLRSLADIGIPVSIVDTDPKHFPLVSENIDPIVYLGKSARVSAEIIAKWLRETSAQRALCIVHRSDNPALNLQCSELERLVEDEIELITVPLGNVSTIDEYEKAIANRLQNIQDIDFIVALSAEVAELVSTATDSMGFDVWIGTLGVDEKVSELLQDRRLLFAVSQQPFLQGYLSVAYLYVHIKYGIAPTEIPQLTGPQIFDSGTVTLLSPFIQDGTR